MRRGAIEGHNRGLVVFCDGGCEPNPGAGGWGFVAYKDGVEFYSSYGGRPDTTNNVMELCGALMALEWLMGIAHDVRARLLCDSQYVVKGANEWRHNWKRNGWARGKAKLANADLWQEIDAVLTTFPITLEWVRGHAGIRGNERADELAEQGRQMFVGRSVSEDLIEQQLKYVA